MFLLASEEDVTPSGGERSFAVSCNNFHSVGIMATHNTVLGTNLFGRFCKKCFLEVPLLAWAWHGSCSAAQRHAELSEGTLHNLRNYSCHPRLYVYCPVDLAICLALKMLKPYSGSEINPPSTQSNYFGNCRNSSKLSQIQVVGSFLQFGEMLKKLRPNPMRIVEKGRIYL